MRGTGRAHAPRPAILAPGQEMRLSSVCSLPIRDRPRAYHVQNARASRQSAAVALFIHCSVFTGHEMPDYLETSVIRRLAMYARRARLPAHRLTSIEDPLMRLKRVFSSHLTTWKVANDLAPFEAQIIQQHTPRLSRR